MKNKILETRLNQEVLDFIHGRKSLQLATLDTAGLPYASYAPFGIGEECLYVLISDIALHAVNLRHNPLASVLVIEDEDTAAELFARKRVNYAVRAELLDYGSPQWQQAMDCLAARHGERPRHLGEHSDFRMFRLSPLRGRYVKGFGKAYDLEGDTLAGEALHHLRDGHKERASAQSV